MLLKIRDLQISFATQAGIVHPVQHVSLDVQQGEILGLVGESGSGKSVTCLALMGLLPERTTQVSGSIVLAGQELIGASSRTWRQMRGSRVAMIFQDPSASLNPVHTIGAQLVEAVRLGAPCLRHEAEAKALKLLQRVGIADAQRRLGEYPHQLSGGMNQRAMIAAALAGRPRLLLADEPTTALDVTIQAQILEVLAGLAEEEKLGIILVTHDLGVVARTAQRVAVMYAGHIVEKGPVGALFARPAHPYTRALMDALPRTDRTLERLKSIPGTVPALTSRIPGCAFMERCPLSVSLCAQSAPMLTQCGKGHFRACHQPVMPLPGFIPSHALHSTCIGHGRSQQGPALLSMRDVRCHFPGRRFLPWTPAPVVRAVDGVSLRIMSGESLGLVGESGCGKSTLGSLASVLLAPTSGQIFFQGQAITPDLAHKQGLRREIQVIFQDPAGTLNPRLSILDQVMEPLRIQTSASSGAIRKSALQSLEQVGLSSEHGNRYPHELSGGQRQRAVVARALVTRPRLVVCDEPTSALDVSIQAQVINLLTELKQTQGMSYLFISHNLGVVRSVCERVAVMYLGQIVEISSREALFDEPLHPYTKALLAANPVPDPMASHTPLVLPGDPPSPVNIPVGCRFHQRCTQAMSRCAAESPSLEDVGAGRMLACFLHPSAKECV